MKSLLVRLTSGIVLIGIIVATGLIGGDVLWAFTLGISLIGLVEFQKVFQIQKNILGYVGQIYTILYFMLLRTKDLSKEMITLSFVVFFMVLMGIYVFQFAKYKTEDIMAAFVGVIYVPVMLSYLYQIRMIDIEGSQEGVYLVWLVFLCSWGCDTCAYASGMLLGKHKLAPILSPKKSIEGAIGGTIGAGILGYIYGVFLAPSPWIFVIICVAGAIVSQIGDLAASAIKRNHNIKDYGKLIPGHGGILDRFDSVIFTLPMIYLLAAFLI